MAFNISGKMDLVLDPWNIFRAIWNRIPNYTEINGVEKHIQKCDNVLHL
jgi:hypothetical protein